MENKFLEKHSDCLFTVFRVVVGLLFLMHGISKWGAISSFNITSLMFYGGIIEIVGGAFILLGLFTRTTAIITALQMLYAFVVMHVFGNGFNLNPVGKTGNGGELALMFLVAFIAIIAYGPGKWSLDNKLMKN